MMAKVEVKNPNIITILYKQEEGDKDYGSCLWADFLIDKENYALHIASDCGDYHHGWLPSAEKQSFLKVLSGFGPDYLLEKLGKRDMVDMGKTYENIEKLVVKAIKNVKGEYTKGNYLDVDMEQIFEICAERSTDAIVKKVSEELCLTSIDGEIEDFEIAECVELEYSTRDKRIVKIFTEYIVPFINNLIVTGED